MTIPQYYIQLLKEYTTLIPSLHAKVESIVSIKTVKGYEVGAVYEKDRGILEQIKRWPKNNLVLPPSAWVEPRKGVVELQDDEKWEFMFHGAGLSFRNIQSDQDVSLEYSINGELGVTNYTFMLYLKTLNKYEVEQHTLLEVHSEYFDELVSQGYLTKVAPLLLQDDQTYAFGLLS